MQEKLLWALLLLGLFNLSAWDLTHVHAGGSSSKPREEWDHRQSVWSEVKWAKAQAKLEKARTKAEAKQRQRDLRNSKRQLANSELPRWDHDHNKTRQETARLANATAATMYEAPRSPPPRLVERYEEVSRRVNAHQPIAIDFMGRSTYSIDWGGGGCCCGDYRCQIKADPKDKAEYERLKKAMGNPSEWRGW